jgi:hypothetical protein
MGMSREAISVRVPDFALLKGFGPGGFKMNIGAVVACSASCLSRIPWWVWFVLVLAGAAIGAISYLAGLLLAGVGGVVVSALLTAMILGALGSVATTFLYCILGCIPKG